MSEPNHVMLLTPAGAGAIAVVRIAGPGVPSFLASHFSKPLLSGRCIHGELNDARMVIDDPVVLLSECGKYADICLHGGPWVVNSAIRLAERNGFAALSASETLATVSRLEEVSELGRETLTSLPLARTELAVRTLLSQRDCWTRWTARNDLGTKEIELILRDRALIHLLNAPRVAIIGIANAGKSTLANRLFAQDRSIVADVPGTTRDWVGAIANLDGLAVELIDTPGLRATSDAIENQAIAKSRTIVDSADTVVVVLDPTQSFEHVQKFILDKHRQAIVVCNKSDCGTIDAPIAVDLRTVATTGKGVDDLRSRLKRQFLGADFEPDRPRWWTERQREILEKSMHDPSRLALLDARL